MASARTRPRFTAHPVHLTIAPVQSIKADITVSIPARIDSVSRHAHDFFEIIYIYHGSGMHEIEGVRRPVTAAQLLILPPGVVHAFPPVKKAWHKHAVLAFRPDAFSRWKTDIDVRVLTDAVTRGKQYLYRVPAALTGAMENSLATMFFEYTMKNPDCAAILRLEALKFFAYCLRTMHGSDDTLSQMSVSDPVVAAALVNMEHSYMHLHSVADILYPSAIHKKYFARLFKRTMHMTPIQYLNRLRIEKCLAPLAANDSTVLQEAYAAGFRDIAHFNRLFRRFIGMSPLEFRTRVRDGAIDRTRYSRFSFRGGK